MNRLLLTGVPGWLTAALLDDLRVHAMPGLGSVGALIHPTFAADAAARLAQYPLLDSFIPYDLGSGASLGSKLAGYDMVLHSAAVIHVRRTEEWYRVNTVGTQRLAEAAKAAGVRRFVFVSSNAAGGRGGRDKVLTEADEPRPLSHYGRSKLLAERSLLQMHEPGRFEVVILRPSMFYGPPVPERHIDVYKRILSGRMPMIGSGGYSRSITYIDNLVQACRLALTHPRAPGQVYYVVDEPVYTTRRICEAMAQALGVSLRVARIPAFASTVAYGTDRVLAGLGIYWQELHLAGEGNWHVGISCDKLKTELGYQPEVALEEGMRRAVTWCREARKL